MRKFGEFINEVNRADKQNHCTHDLLATVSRTAAIKILSHRIGKIKCSPILFRIVSSCVFEMRYCFGAMKDKNIKILRIHYISGFIDL